MKTSFITRSVGVLLTLGALVAPAFAPAIAATPLGTDSVTYPVDASKVVLTQGYGAHHTAIDLAPRHKGEPMSVVSAADGQVIVATDCATDADNRWCASFGNTVVVKHPSGYRTMYGHLSRIDVKVGDNVSAGQSLGLLGETGYVIKPWNDTGAVLHFAVCNTYCSRANLKDTTNPLSLFPNFQNHATAAATTEQEGG